jgi:hypothetical protein
MATNACLRPRGDEVSFGSELGDSMFPGKASRELITVLTVP